MYYFLCAAFGLCIFSGGFYLYEIYDKKPPSEKATTRKWLIKTLIAFVLVLLLLWLLTFI